MLRGVLACQVRPMPGMFRKRRAGSLIAGAVLLLIALPPLARAADTAQFPGAGGNNYWPERELPTTWEADAYRWQVDLGGRDVGSPIVFGQKVYLLSGDAKTAARSLVSLDLKTGQERWRRTYAAAASRLHARNTYGSSTPAADADHVYAAWADPEHTWIRCFSHDGDEVWSRDLGRWTSQHGFGTSPVRLGELLVLFDSQQGEQLRDGQPPGQSRMIALDPKTGQTVWETPLKTTRVCYGVPAFRLAADGQAQIVAANTGNGLFGLDFKTGEMLWSQPVFRARCVSSPIVYQDLVLGSSGSGGGGNHLVAVRPEQSDSGEAYRIERGAPYVPTPVVADGKLFMIDDKGIASCVDASTGDPFWMKRVGGNFEASPIVIGDKLLVISLAGEATVLAAEETYRKLSQFDLGGSVGATPVYGSGTLLLRIDDRLCCLPLDR